MLELLKVELQAFLVLLQPSVFLETSCSMLRRMVIFWVQFWVQELLEKKLGTLFFRLGAIRLSIPENSAALLGPVSRNC